MSDQKTVVEEKPDFPDYMLKQPRWLVRRRNLESDSKQPWSPIKTKPAAYVPSDDPKETEITDYWRYRWTQTCLWVTYTYAVAFLAKQKQKQQYDGLSFVIHPAGDNGDSLRIICIDCDKAFNPEGRLWLEVRNLLAALRGVAFVEYSRSGKGIHIFVLVRCVPFRNVYQAEINDHCKVDVLCSSQVAVTGRVFEDFSTLEETDFGVIEAHPIFHYKPADTSACNFEFNAEWWNEDEEPLGDEHEYLAQEMREWPEAVSGKGGSNHCMAAACRLMKAGVVGWQALRLLEMAPAEPPWSENELKHKLESAYKDTVREGTFNGACPEFEAITDGDEEKSAASVRVVDRTPIDLVNEREEKPWPADFASHVWQNPIGEYVLANDPNTEADPHNVYMDLSEMAGVYNGRQGRFHFNNSVNYLNNYLCNIGDTGSRKESAYRDALAAASHDGEPTLFFANNILGGITTGEGIIVATADSMMEPETARGSTKRPINHSRDGRKLCRAPELSRVMAKLKQDDNTLGAVLREAYDGGILSINRAGNPITSSDACIGWISDTTPEEFKLTVRAIDIFNGLFNRKRFNAVRRSKTLPNPGRTPDHVLATFCDALEKTRDWLRAESEEGREFFRSAAADEVWRDWYLAFNDAHESAMVDALSRRAPTHVMREAMLLAAFDKTAEIQPTHLFAAIDIWRRCQDSARLLVGGMANSDVMTLLDAIAKEGTKGMTRTQIRDLFHRNKDRDEITQLLRELQKSRLVKGDKLKGVERWYFDAPKG